MCFVDVSTEVSVYGSSGVMALVHSGGVSRGKGFA